MKIEDLRIKELCEIIDGLKSAIEFLSDANVVEDRDLKKMKESVSKAKILLDAFLEAELKETLQ